MSFRIAEILRWLFGPSSTGRIAAFDPNYRHFTEVILSSSRGSSEIDHLIVSPYGLFVIEYKDYSGWIFGDESSRKWTAMYYGDKYSFQNPLHQNFGHVKAVQEVLGVESWKVHAAVVFRGSFEFKTPIPRGVFLYSCADWIHEKQRVALSEPEIERVLAKLKNNARSGFFAAGEHVRSLIDRYESITACPKCGGRLVERIAKNGPVPGSRFLGCSNYPTCKYTRNQGVS
jgi:hypothetical protein